MADNKPNDEELDKDLEQEELDKQEQEELDKEEEELEEEEELDSDEESEEDEDEEEEKPKSRREQLRIQQLIEKLKEKDETPAQKPTKPDDAIDYSKSLDADEEVIEKLTADRDSFGERMYQQGLEEAKSIRFLTRLEVDAPRVEAKYPQLDKNSEEFNPALAKSINEMYLSTVGFDPKTQRVRNANIRYSDYVESMFELADEMATAKVADTQKNIRKQAASTGMRPDGSSAKKLNLNKAPGDMTDEELDAFLKRAGMGTGK